MIGNRNMLSRKILAYDDFSEANGTAIIGKSLDLGGTWQQIRNDNSCTPTVQSGKYTSLVTNGVINCGFLTNYTDYIVSGSLKVSTLVSALIARWDGNSSVLNTSGCWVEGRIQNDSAIKAIRILVFSAGAGTVVASSTVTPSSTTEYKCSLIVSQLRVTFVTPLGTVTTTLPDTFRSYTGCGCSIGTYNASVATVDNFKVESII